MQLKYTISLSDEDYYYVLHAVEAGIEAMKRERDSCRQLDLDTIADYYQDLIRRTEQSKNRLLHHEVTVIEETNNNGEVA